ncbi:glycolate oxidase subunit GlcE [uncultured Maritimibacter sp.]|jgi:glycolate oxidase FAD binding subunit|uniref:glycolate oxidase subunit GlcE n=1 Tax=uncultured Maritimibacter sp. TaxID=991866 RepID=UPI000ABE7D0A|nr:glycolate oxidase subunit GlcE [uncultured Maritimibacter sp.]
MRVSSESELVEAIAGATGPLRIVGGGTRDVGRPVVGEVLEVGLSGVELYEPGSLTLIVKAGTPVAEVSALLAGEQQRLAFEPMDYSGVMRSTGASTIGGVVAANASGPRRIQAGAVRDFTLGTRFVDGAGRVVKNGGRVMKNVTGYDLVKLMAGSWGTLGVLSEVSLKVQPIPEAQVTLVRPVESLAEAVGFMSAALGSPFDVTGAATTEAFEVAIRLEGSAFSVDYRAKELLGGVLAGFERVEGAGSAAIWDNITRLAPFVGNAQDLWRVSLKPGDAPSFHEAVRGIAGDCLFDWGGGLIWLGVNGVTTAEAAQTIRAALAPLGGHATLIRASTADRQAVPVFQPQAPRVAALSRAIKQKFDPRGILNPGLMDH